MPGTIHGWYYSLNQWAAKVIEVLLENEASYGKVSNDVNDYNYTDIHGGRAY